MRIDKVVHEGKTFFNVGSKESSLPQAVLLKAITAQLGETIDTAAGNARAAFVSPGSYIDQEYLLAKQEALTWVEKGKDESDVPSSVADHMAMFEVGAEEAATVIIETAEQWEQALTLVRRARLAGKAAVRSADSIEDAKQAAQAAIAELDTIRPEEGAL